VYTNTLDSARRSLVRLIELEEKKSMTVTQVLNRIPLDEYVPLLANRKWKSCGHWRRLCAEEEFQMVNSTRWAEASRKS